MHKTSKSVKGQLKRFSIKGNGWETAIAEAERQLLSVNNRAARLRAVIENFKRLQAGGHPWPGESATPN
jgi:hypothetical protein